MVFPASKFIGEWADLEQPKGLSNEAIGRLVQTCKLFSDETRLRIVNVLIVDGELHVQNLCKRLRQNQSVVSHHLAILREAGFVEGRRDGKHKYYRTRSLEWEALLHCLLAPLPADAPQIRCGDYVLTWSS